LYLELTARELYPEAFFGGKVSDSVKERQRKLLDRYIPGFAKLAKFSPYIAGIPSRWPIAPLSATCR
jgi:glutathione S-transferase